MYPSTSSNAATTLNNVTHVHQLHSCTSVTFRITSSLRSQTIAKSIHIHTHIYIFYTHQCQMTHSHTAHNPETSHTRQHTVDADYCAGPPGGVRRPSVRQGTSVRSDTATGTGESEKAESRRARVATADAVDGTTTAGVVHGKPAEDKLWHRTTCVDAQSPPPPRRPVELDR